MHINVGIFCRIHQVRKETLLNMVRCIFLEKFRTKLKSNLNFLWNIHNILQIQQHLDFPLKSGKTQLCIQNTILDKWWCMRWHDGGSRFFVSIKKVFGRRCLYSPAKHTQLFSTHQEEFYLGVFEFTCCARQKKLETTWIAWQSFTFLSIWVYI